MARIEILSRLSRAERQRLRRWVERMADFDADDVLRKTDRGAIVTAGDYEDASDERLEAHRIARRCMLAIGRTFDYEVV